MIQEKERGCTRYDHNQNEKLIVEVFHFDKEKVLSEMRRTNVQLIDDQDEILRLFSADFKPNKNRNPLNFLLIDGSIPHDRCRYSGASRARDSNEPKFLHIAPVYKESIGIKSKLLTFRTQREGEFIDLRVRPVDNMTNGRFVFKIKVEDDSDDTFPIIDYKYNDDYRLKKTKSSKKANSSKTSGGAKKRKIRTGKDEDMEDNDVKVIEERTVPPKKNKTPEKELNLVLEKKTIEKEKTSISEKELKKVKTGKGFTAHVQKVPIKIAAKRTPLHDESPTPKSSEEISIPYVESDGPVRKPTETTELFQKLKTDPTLTEEEFVRHVEQMAFKLSTGNPQIIEQSRDLVTKKLNDDYTSEMARFMARFMAEEKARIADEIKQTCMEKMVQDARTAVMNEERAKIMRDEGEKISLQIRKEAENAERIRIAKANSEKISGMREQEFNSFASQLRKNTDSQFGQTFGVGRNSASNRSEEHSNGFGPYIW